MKAPEIIHGLESNSIHGFELKARIKQESSIKEMLVALQSSRNGHVRQVICDILGELYANEAVFDLIIYLDDTSDGVRSSAADALGKIGDVAAGPALLEHFVRSETSQPVRRMLAAALGAVQYHEAIPALISALKEEDDSMRGTAAWSLGHLDATDAYQYMIQASTHETSHYAIAQLTQSINHLSKLID